MTVRDYLALFFASFNLAFVAKILLASCRYRSNGIVGFSLYLRFVITAAILPVLALISKIPSLYFARLYGESLLTATAFFAYAFFNNFALTAFGRFKKNHRLVLYLCSVIPFVGAFLALSNPWTHLFFLNSDAASDVLFFVDRDNSEGTTLLFSFSTALVVILLILAGIALFSPVKAIRQARGLNLTMVLSMLLPFAGDLFRRIVPAAAGIGLSYFALSITAYVILQNYWAYLPHSRRTAAELISSFYMVFDTHGRCTDINIQGQEFFRLYGRRGLPTMYTLADLSGIPVSVLLTAARSDFELDANIDEAGSDSDTAADRRYYRLQAFPVRPGLIRGNGLGFLITDVTSYRARENSLAVVANHDALTQVHNRRFFSTYFEQLKERHAGSDITILMIDADHFKNINDTYGHLAGDEVLRTIASRVRSCLRTSDLICRYGGEEFVVLLGSTPSAGMEIVANRILRAISDHPFVFEMTRTAKGLVTTEEMNIRVTVSIGAYSAVLSVDTSLDVLIEHADDAMYDAKEGGRNCLRFVDGKAAPAENIGEGI